MNLSYVKINSITYTLSLLFLLVSTLGFSQKKKKDTLGTEVIRVVKPYSPSVSDAFKIKKEPNIDDIQVYDKKEIRYEINSVPVASTFVPEKGKPKGLLQKPRERFYNNYASIGFGNYLTPFVDAFAHYNLTRYSDIGGFLNYRGSFQNLKNVPLNSTYSDLNFDAYYKQNERFYNWQVRTGISKNDRNWYGLPEAISFSESVMNAIDEKQGYGSLYLGGEVEFYDALVHNGSLYYTHFFDAYESAENHVQFKGNVEFPVWNELIDTYITLEYLNGNFAQNFMNTGGIGHNFINVGLHPNFTMRRDNLSLNIGARLYYGYTDNDNDESQFYYYPNITAQYKISGDNLIAYLGATGDLTQNTYRDFVSENPFVSPTLAIRRTSQPYLGYLGAKGKLASSFTFNAKGYYGKELDKALFKLNPSKTNGNTPAGENYAAGNSFGVVYDDVTTIGAFAELMYDFNENLKFGGNFEFNTYQLENESEAWNLPMIKASLLAKYKQEKWYANTNIYYMGERKDELTIIPTDKTTGINNNMFFDINIDGGYYINDSWSVFLKLNNILNTRYERFANYPVQGFQILGGATFRFDF